jgi:DNA-binding response OmpR family regulator
LEIGAWEQRAHIQAGFDTESRSRGPFANQVELRQPERMIRASTGRAISFGPFRLLPAQRLLLYANKAVPLGSRALDILVALAERSGELLGRDTHGPRMAEHVR